MKRRDLIKRISKEAAQHDIEFGILREGADHTVYILGGQRVPIPRHNEINELTAKGIMKQAGTKLGEGWWK